MFFVSMKKPKDTEKLDIVYQKVRFTLDSELSNPETWLSQHQWSLCREKTNALDSVTSTLDKLFAWQTVIYSWILHHAKLITNSWKKKFIHFSRGFSSEEDESVKQNLNQAKQSIVNGSINNMN